MIPQMKILITEYGEKGLRKIQEQYNEFRKENQKYYLFNVTLDNSEKFWYMTILYDSEIYPYGTYNLDNYEKAKYS